MSKWKEGDRVRVVQREVTEEDRKSRRYYSHMAGLIGSVEYVFDDKMVGIKIEPSSLTSVSADVHREATERMRAKISDEQKKSFEPEEINFPVNFSLLVLESDLEKASS